MTPAEILIQSLVALGTLAVAILAIWGEFFRSMLASPELELNLSTHKGELTRFGDGKPVRYYHIKVSNRRRWAPAYNCRVQVTRIQRRTADASFANQQQTAPLQLTWSFPQYSPQFPTVGPTQVCDLGYVTENEFKLSTYFTPNNFAGFLTQADALRAEIEAVADNGQSAPILLEISWDGKWADGESEMARHLIIKVCGIESR